MVVELLIAPDGTVRTIYSDETAPLLNALGPSSIRRASHVEPREDGGWNADMSPVGGPTLGPFATRKAALDAEVAWLREHNIPIPTA